MENSGPALTKQNKTMLLHHATHQFPLLSHGRSDGRYEQCFSMRIHIVCLPRHENNVENAPRTKNCNEDPQLACCWCLIIRKQSPRRSNISSCQPPCVYHTPLHKVTRTNPNLYLRHSPQQNSTNANASKQKKTR